MCNHKLTCGNSSVHFHHQAGNLPEGLPEGVDQVSYFLCQKPQGLPATLVGVWACLAGSLLRPSLTDDLPHQNFNYKKEVDAAATCFFEPVFFSCAHQVTQKGRPKNFEGETENEKCRVVAPWTNQICSKRTLNHYYCIQNCII